MTKISDVSHLYPRAFDDTARRIVLTIFEPGGRVAPATCTILEPEYGAWSMWHQREAEIEAKCSEIPRSDPRWLRATKHSPIIRQQQRELGYATIPPDFG